MRIVAAKAQTIRLGAAARSASISFDDMTATALAIHTDARSNGKALAGLAFDSIGRYDHSGLLNDRFIPRLLAADPQDYAGEDGGIDPFRVWAILMKNEKPGGHGERCGAVGLIDAALWDLAAKRADVPLWRRLSELEPGNDNGRTTADVYASGGHYRPRPRRREPLRRRPARDRCKDTGGSRSRSAAPRSTTTSNASRRC